MKIPKMAIIAIILLVMTSCNKDNDDILSTSAEAAELNLIMKQGSWTISNFVKNDENLTADFKGYDFSFEENNVLQAISSTDQISGSWRASNDSGSEYDSYYDLDFNIFFSASTSFESLTSNYNVVSATSNEVKLEMKPNAASNTGSLTFIKN